MCSARRSAHAPRKLKFYAIAPESSVLLQPVRVKGAATSLAAAWQHQSLVNAQCRDAGRAARSDSILGCERLAAGNESFITRAVPISVSLLMLPVLYAKLHGDEQ